MKKHIVYIITLLISFNAHAQLAVTNNSNATQLAQSLSGQGVIIANPTLTCGTASSGTFTATATNLGIGAGIVLSTGAPDDAINNNEGTGSGVNTADADITSITTGVQKDVCRLEFDVTPNCNKIDVSYVFASSEYPNYVGSTYNDAFGFFISGPGIVGTKNMALIPSTTTPVSINNVNSGSNSTYFVDNPTPFNPPFNFPPAPDNRTIKYYGGFTTPLQASSTVQACSTYHVKIVIADIGDDALNSAIFLSNNAVNCNPVAAVTASNDTAICPGASTPLSATGTAGNVYTWSPATGLNTTTGANVIASPTVTTKYYVSTPVTLCGGVISTVIDSVTVTMKNGSLIPAVITNVPPVCATSLAFSMVANVGGGVWSGTGISNATTGIFNPATAGVGTHIITYVITGACGNTQDTALVTVGNAPPAPIISAVTPICLPSATITLTADVAGGTWSGLGITNTTTGNFDPAIAGAGTDTITYSITAACGVIKDTVVITINNVTPTPVITAVAPICLPNATISLTADVVGGTWSGTGVTNATTGVFDPNVAGAGIHTVTYALTGVCGNTQDTVLINVANNVTPVITAPWGMCSQDATINLTADVAGGVWTGVGITNTNIGTFNPTTAGVGIHIITYTLAGGCGTPGTKNIVVKNAIVPVLSNDTAICKNDKATLYIKNATLLHNITWLTNSGVLLLGNGPVTVAPLVPQKYYVAALDTANCASLDSVMVQVNPLPQAVFTPTEVCFNTPTVFQNQSVGAIRGYLTFGDGFADSLNTTLIHKYTTVGTFFANYICVSPYGCRDTAQVSVNVNANPQINFTADTTKGCAPLCVRFTNTSTANTYTWLANAVVFSDLDNPTHCFATGTSTIMLIGKDTKGCKDTLVRTNYLTAYPTPQVNISVDPPVTSMLNPDVTIINNSDVANNTHYYWNLGNDTLLYTNTLQSIYHTYADTGHYKITQIAENKFGCADTGYTLLIIDPMVSMYIPNAFTPNADGTNDYFDIKSIGVVDYTLDIFDRWGTRVSTVVYADAQGWNGKYLKTNNDCKQDYYVWKLSYKTLKKETYYKAGTVTLLK
ncbi:MAG: choice-of-anchor L domain-containing protein [Bacteroidia bacterium]